MTRRRNRKKRIARFGIFAVLLLVLLVLLFVFRAQKIDVYGNSRHSSDEIAAGLLNEVPGDNTLYLLWKYRNGTVPDTLPFLDSLKVQMKSPFHVMVSVTERPLAGYVDKGQAVYFDSSGVVMEITDEIYENIPIITGASTTEAVLYQKLPTESGAQLRTILSILQLLEYQELTAEEIRFGENSEITVFIGGVEARLGQDEYLEEKIANLRSILNKMDESDRGTLHLESFTGGTANVMFSPSDETEPVETEAGDSSGNEFGNGSGDAAGIESGIESGAEAGDGTVSDGEDGSGDSAEDTSSGGEPFMAFDSSGTLRYDVRVVNGVAVDGSGNPVPGCTVNENGYVVDAYMNVIDPATGQPIQQ